MVVDLETTGGSPQACEITEIGAVKVRGGEVLGEFQTLVDPGVPIPPFISVLTGITDATVAGALRLGSALPAFLEFVGGTAGTVLVAHNAPFDMSFLKAACAMTEHEWPGHQVLDTARLARHVVTRDEAPNCKLASLARLFGPAPPRPPGPVRCAGHSRRTPRSARAARQPRRPLLDELATFSSRVSPAQRRKRHLAEGLPHRPASTCSPMSAARFSYVGKSHDLRNRVRTYFTASETRTRMAEMVGLAASVTPIVCATPLEAEVRELRLIAAHKPRYNRRSRFPSALWLKLTVEPFRGCPRCARSRTTARPTSARSPPGARSSSRWRRCTRRSGCGSARRGSPAPADVRMRARRDGQVRWSV